MTAVRRRFLSLGLLFSLCAGLAACGFQLRGDWTLPFASIYVDLPESSEIGANLRRTLRGTQATRVVGSPREAEAMLVPTGEMRDKVALSFSGAGRVSEYQIKLRFSFRLIDRGGLDLIEPASIAMTREFTHDESKPLAKAQEEEMLWRDMAGDLTQQVLRRLAAARKPGVYPEKAEKAETMGPVGTSGALGRAGKMDSPDKVAPPAAASPVVR